MNLSDYNLLNVKSIKKKSFIQCFQLSINVLFVNSNRTVVTKININTLNYRVISVFVFAKT